MRVMVFEPRHERHKGLGNELARARLAASFEVGSLAPTTANLRTEAGSTPPVVIADGESVVDDVASLRRAGFPNIILVMRDGRGAARTAELLEAGADDVVIAPIKGAEIRARIEACERRARGVWRNEVAVGELTVHLCGRNPEFRGEEIALTRSEHAVLRHLALSSPHVVSKEGLHEALYGSAENAPQSTIIEVHIFHIRRKIDAAGGCGKKILPTVARRGYCLAGPKAATTRSAVPEVSAA